MFRPQTSKSGFLFQGVKVNFFAALDISMRTYNDIQLLSFFFNKKPSLSNETNFREMYKAPRGAKNTQRAYSNDRHIDRRTK